MNFKSKSNKSSLTGSKVLDIRHLHDVDGYNDAELARMYKVSRKAIYNIVNRKTWRNVPKPVKVTGFKNYTLFPDGRVFSNLTGDFVNAMKRKSGPAVRLKTSNGQRKTMAVNKLLVKGFKNKL